MTFRLFLEQESLVDIEDLLPHKDDLEVAVHSLSQGRPSTDKSPINVYQNKVVADGHHRLLQAILKGEARVKINTLPGVVSTNGTIPLDFYDGDYYGLDSSLSNGWLLKRLSK
jgi:hypothetical protein